MLAANLCFPRPVDKIVGTPHRFEAATASAEYAGYATIVLLDARGRV
jgi:hypothetical protein